MNAWSHILAAGIGAAVGGCAVWFECCAGLERRAQMQRDARLRVGGRPLTSPRSNCRRLDDDRVAP